jgi:hypothetical protein
MGMTSGEDGHFSMSDAVNDKLFRHTPIGYTHHEKITVDYDKDANQTIIEPSIPDHAIPVDVVDRKYTFSIRWGYWQSVAPMRANEEQAVDSILDILPTLDQWECQLLFDLELCCNEMEIWQALVSQQCFIATDGSAPEGKGSFGWVLSDANGNILAQCKGPVFGA